MTLKQIVYEYFKDFIRKDELYSLEGTFVNVRANDALSDFIPLDGAKVLDVQLGIVTGEGGVLTIPAEGSKGVITFTSPQTAFAIVTETAEQFIAVGGTSRLELSSDTVKLNGGEVGGMVIPSSLVTKINAIEADLNQLKAVFAAWVPVPTDGGLVLKTAATPWAAASLTPTVVADIENDKVKQ